ncbi:MAG: LPXTG cell wall anchor domain-containing protein [Tissierellia bacterium]|nr:LPXTG cell wall anchor domain-containing protein [Tissierellia bacterium]
MPFGRADIETTETVEAEELVELEDEETPLALPKTGASSSSLYIGALLILIGLKLRKKLPNSFILTVL